VHVLSTFVSACVYGVRACVCGIWFFCCPNVPNLYLDNKTTLFHFLLFNKI